MRMPFGRLLSMFRAEDPRAEQYFQISIIAMAALAVAIMLVVVIRICHRRRSNKLAREIMEKCEEEDRHSIK